MALDAEPDGELRIRLLGPLQVRLAGNVLNPGGPRQRSLLALLALSAGTAVRPAQLIDALWDDEPPPTALNTVQVYLSRLRRLLTSSDPASSPIRTITGLYLLDLTPESVDALQFERLAALGREALASGEPAGAASVLRQALQLWHGGALPDLAGTSAGTAVIARLESIRLAALADRADADAALGRHRALVPELQELVGRYPFDERFVARLMLSLYLDGRQAEALAAYTAAAGRLVDELGVDPGPALRSVHARVLAQDEDLLTAPSSQPIRIAAALAPGSPGAPVAPVGALAPGAPVHPAGAPDVQDAHGALIGRQRELTELRALLDRPGAQLVTLVGPGGAGKTRLARELLELAGPETVFVQLASVSDVTAVLPQICQALGAVADWAGEAPLDLALRVLENRSVLMVLDNLEQLTGAGLGDVHRLIEGCPGLRILATSRELLRLPGEQLLTLGPLLVPAAGADPRTVQEAGAVQLFRERARAALAGFEVSAANSDAVAELCRRLDGLPLALELAAARIRVLPPEEILRRLDRRLQLLSGGSEQLPERQRSMWAALDWSVRLLEPVERRMLAQLSVFAGGWTLDAAEQVCDASPLAAPGAVVGQVVDVLGRLADKSLLVADGSGRVSLLEMVRDFAAELLAADPDAARQARSRHAAYFAGLAGQLGRLAGDWNGAAGAQQRARIHAESGNLLAALEHCADPAHGDPELLSRLVGGLLGYWFYAGRLAEAERWLQVARDADPSAGSRAGLLLSFANLAVIRGDLDASAALLDEAADGLRQLGDRALDVRSLAIRAMVHRHRGDAGAALAVLQQALELSAALGSEPMTRALENDRAEILDELGHAEEAAGIWLELQSWLIDADNPAQLSYVLGNLARSELDTDGPAADGQARALAADALVAAEQSESISARADCLAVAGVVDLRTGQLADGLTRLRRAVRETHYCGQLLTLPDVVTALGAGLVAADQAAAGARLLAAADAWRNARSMVLFGRSVRALAAAAELALESGRVGAEQLSTEQLATERRRGARTPFGSLRGLTLLDPGLAVTTVLNLTELPGPDDGGRPGIDLRDVTTSRA